MIYFRTYFLPSFPIPKRFSKLLKGRLMNQSLRPLHAGHLQRSRHLPAALLHLAPDRMVPRRILPHPGRGLGIARRLRSHDAEVPGLHEVDGKRPVHAQGDLPGAGAGGQVGVERP